MRAAATPPAIRRARIAVLDDHAAVRLGLERVLRREPGLRFVAALGDERELLGAIAREPVDVVVLDYELARGDGLSVCQRLKQGERPPAVLIYSAYAGPGLLVAAAIAQADAVVGKAEPVSHLLDSIRRVARGERLVPAPAGDRLAAATARVEPNDAPVVALLVDGATVSEIARALSIDEREAVSRTRRVIGRLHPRRGARPGGSAGVDLHAGPHSRARDRAGDSDHAPDRDHKG